MSQWLPIATAPKDGTPVLGFMPSYYQGKGGQSVILWMDTNGRGGRWFDNRAWETEPTHWMALPDPPTAEPNSSNDFWHFPGRQP
jgi:hypothetical protein